MVSDLYKQWKGLRILSSDIELVDDKSNILILNCMVAYSIYT